MINPLHWSEENQTQQDTRSECSCRRQPRTPRKIKKRSVLWLSPSLRASICRSNPISDFGEPVRRLRHRIDPCRPRKRSRTSIQTRGPKHGIAGRCCPRLAAVRQNERRRLAEEDCRFTTQILDASDRRRCFRASFSVDLPWPPVGAAFDQSERSHLRTNCRGIQSRPQPDSSLRTVQTEMASIRDGEQTQWH